MVFFSTLLLSVLLTIALVRLITPVYESERLSDAEARLQAFTRDLVPVLDRFLPGKE